MFKYTHTVTIHLGHMRLYRSTKILSIARHGKESKKIYICVRDKQYRAEQNTYTNKNKTKLTIKCSNLHNCKPEKFFVKSQLPCYDAAPPLPLYSLIS